MKTNKYVIALLLTGFCSLASAKMSDAQRTACLAKVQEAGSATQIAGAAFYNCKVKYIVGNVGYDFSMVPNPRVDKATCLTQARAGANQKCNSL